MLPRNFPDGDRGRYSLAELGLLACCRDDWPASNLELPPVNWQARRLDHGGWILCNVRTLLGATRRDKLRVRSTIVMAGLFWIRAFEGGRAPWRVRVQPFVRPLLPEFPGPRKACLRLFPPNEESPAFLEGKVRMHQVTLSQTSRTRPCTRYPWLSALGGFGLRVRLLSVRPPFRVGRHHLKVIHHRLLRERALTDWKKVTCVC